MARSGLKKIRLELARTHGFPEGSTRHGYEFVAPLDAEGKIDAEAWHAVRARCRVRRFWGDEEDDVGHLVHRPGGSWAFRYDVSGDEDDESGHRFGAHRFEKGEYVSIRDADGELETFTVAAVTEA